MRPGWTEERRARQAATIERRRLVGAQTRALHALGPEATIPLPVDPLDALAFALRAEITALRRRVDELEARPAVREWRPDHRREADGGVPVRSQRRAVGVPRRPRAIA